MNPHAIITFRASGICLPFAHSSNAQSPAAILSTGSLHSPSTDLRISTVCASDAICSLFLIVAAVSLLLPATIGGLSEGGVILCSLGVLVIVAVLEV